MGRYFFQYEWMSRAGKNQPIKMRFRTINSNRYPDKDADKLYCDIFPDVYSNVSSNNFCHIFWQLGAHGARQSRTLATHFCLRTILFNQSFSTSKFPPSQCLNFTPCQWHVSKTLHVLPTPAFWDWNPTSSQYLNFRPLLAFVWVHCPNCLSLPTTSCVHL